MDNKSLELGEVKPGMVTAMEEALLSELMYLGAFDGDPSSDSLILSMAAELAGNTSYFQHPSLPVSPPPTELPLSTGVDSNRNPRGQIMPAGVSEGYHWVGYFPDFPSKKTEDSSDLGSYLYRIQKALERYASLSGGDILAQVWAPVKRGNKLVLVTDAQPFALAQSPSSVLLRFRQFSTSYTFPTNPDPDPNPPSLGLPGRVYLNRTVEWTPNVQLYRPDEYHRAHEAARCNVQGTIGLPVFDQDRRHSCIAVIEIAMLSQRIAYADEIDSICRALQAVNLCSPEIHNRLPMQVETPSQQAVLKEILEVLTAVGETHKLPLAQTWLPYYCYGEDMKERREERGWRSSSCLCTKGAPFYASEMPIYEFHQACEEHCLEKGQGMPGQAFRSNKPCFSSDVRRLVKSEYPLGHHARIFQLSAVVAVRLRSVFTGSADYVLEFFLPRMCTDSLAQQSLLNALSVTMQHVCRTLRTVTDKELEEEEKEVVNTLPKRELLQVGSSDLEETIALPVETQQQQISLSHDHCSLPPPYPPVEVSGTLKRKQDSSRRGGSVEKKVGLSNIQKYFAGSLKDAAKSLGVCPTTLKRICRQHGISRWPSRKIKKVNQSLKKLQAIMDSVQGMESTALRIDELAVANFASAVACSSTGGEWVPNHDCNSDPNINLPASAQAGQPHPSNTKTEYQCIELGAVGAQHQKQSHRFSKVEAKKQINMQAEVGQTAIAEKQSSAAFCGEGTTCTSAFTNNDNGHKIIVSIEEEHRPEEQAISHRPHLGSSSSSSSSSSSHSSIARVSQRRREVKEEGCWTIIKAKHGDDMVRFKVRQTTGYRELREEVGKRFQLEVESFGLKYLDEEEEWIMLTCDADLQECIEIMKSLGSNHIKLYVRH